YQPAGLVADEDRFPILPRRIGPSEKNTYLFSLFSRPLLQLSLSLTIQSSVKYALTYGDQLLMSSLASYKDQGAYGLASNYGGLVARMLFQPIEESSRNLFAKLCAPQDITKEADASKSPDQSTSDRKPSRQGLRQAQTTLENILRIYSLIGLVAFALGPTAAPLLLRLVAGSRWIDIGAGEVLATYCYYIPLLAFNGVTEAFIAAVAGNRDLFRQSSYGVAFFATFAGAAYYFLAVLETGAQGLVWANCVNMGLRIFWNLGFVRSYFERFRQVGRGVLAGGMVLADGGQSFDVLTIVPGYASIAATAVVPFVLKKTTTLFSGYGLPGEMIRVAGIGVCYVVIL
ncbi:hypothetical protein LTR28_002100, partial [Elasticomyces elasticus]